MTEPFGPPPLPPGGYPPPLPPGAYPPPPGYAYPPPYVVVRSTNTMAILALVMAFVFAPAAIVLGHIARKQIAERQEDGDGLALAGLIIGYIQVGIFVLFCGAYIAIFAALIPGAGGG